MWGKDSTPAALIRCGSNTSSSRSSSCSSGSGSTGSSGSGQQDADATAVPSDLAAVAHAAGLDPRPLELLRRELREKVDAHGLPGYSLGVTWNANTVLSECYGLRDLARGLEVHDDTLFRQYSMTKAIVCCAFMTFFDEQLVGLDDPISSFLGEAWEPKLAVSAPEAPGLQVVVSDGVMRGMPDDPEDHMIIADGEIVFLRASPSGLHVDIDPQGHGRCRWDDPGIWQAFQVNILEPAAPLEQRVSLRAHTGQFLDVSGNRIVASSPVPKTWVFLQDETEAEESGFLVGCTVRVQHEETSSWLQAPEAAEHKDSLVTSFDASTATEFVIEKQSWILPSLVPAGRQITIRHLLTHTSGLDYSGLEEKSRNALDALLRGLVERCERGEIASLAEWVAELAKIPLSHHPGTEFEYGYSTDVLGRIVEVLGKAPLDQILQDRILAPLGMTSTGFSTSSEEALGRLAALYRCSGDSALIDDPSSSLWVPPLGPAPILSAGGGVETLRGGLLSTCPDYLRFCNMLLQGGELDGVRILCSSTVDLMVKERHLEAATGNPKAEIWDGRGWGLLGSIDLPDQMLRSSSSDHPAACGWNGWAGTSFRVFPFAGLAYVFMTNCIDNDMQFEELIIKRIWEAMPSNT